VLTNVHVIEGADGLEIVTDDGLHHVMQVKDTIPTYDIALLEFPGRAPRGLVDVRVKGNVSERRIREGTWVIATGNPFFLALDGASVTTLGVVSGTGRVLGGRFNYVNAVQHDAEVNPGNSGGPVWTLKGDLVGLNGMIMSRPTFPGARPTNTGASFALPAEQLEAFLRQLTSKSDAKCGFLGVDTTTFTDSKGKAAGAEVARIAPRSPVTQGSNSLQEKDVITQFGTGGGSRIYTSTDLQEALSVLPCGARVLIKYKRGSRTYTWRGELAEGR
jgi:serine protease Do